MTVGIGIGSWQEMSKEIEEKCQKKSKLLEMFTLFSRLVWSSQQ